MEHGMNFFLFTASFFVFAAAASAQVTPDTPVSEEQFLKSCRTSVGHLSNPEPYCNCVALEIAKVSTTERELLLGRQVIASMDPAFGIPSYRGDDLKTYIDVSGKALNATIVCGRASTKNTLNPDGTIQ
jgi:hypothetical protein